MRKLWNRFDALLIPALLAAAMLFYFFYGAPASEVGGTCEVIVNGSTVMTVRLDKDRFFSPPGLPEVVLEVKNGGIAFVRSDCPDKICVLSGYLRAPGQMAACLPNRVAIRIARGPGDDEPDAVV